MSWSKTTATVLLAAALSGCGFRPLYAPTQDSPGARGFNTVYIQQVPDRLGQQFRNDLLDLITPRGEPAQPVYDLSARLSESQEQLAVQKTASATRANVRMAVSFALIERATSVPVWNGSATSVASYNILDSEYATLAALEDVRKRTLRQLAEKVRIRLGLFFHRGTEPDGVPQKETDRPSR